MARRPSIPLTFHTADLATEFGRDWATKLFGEEAIASLPTRHAGKNKGAPKGFVIWRKANGSGWCAECQSPVRAGQLVDAWIGTGAFTPRSEAVSGNWLGRVQPMGCSASTGYFFDEGRARHAAEAAREAEWRAEQIRQIDADMKEGA